jgi:hypothetical protein
MSPHHLFKPPHPLILIKFIKNQQKRKGGEERRRGEEAAKPYPHVGLEVL